MSYQEAYCTFETYIYSFPAEWSYYWSDGSFIICCSAQPSFHTFHADIIMLSTSTSHHPVACVVGTKYLNELVRGIRFPAKHAGLKRYVGILSSNFPSFPPLHLSSCCSRPQLQYELLPSILDNIIVIR